MKVARVYLRVSSTDQDLRRQASIIGEAKANGFYIAGTYREKASGSRADRPELLRLINDLQPGEFVVAERLDRISRLPLPEAERLIATIRDKGAYLCIPNVLDLRELIATSESPHARIVLESIQDMLLRLTLQAARDDYEDRRFRQRQGIELAKQEGKFKGRSPNQKLKKLIPQLRAEFSISKTAELAGCSISTVKRIMAEFKKKSDA